jgi:alpha/beta superfamily hydrolase
MNPFYFGESESPLFGCHHPPRTQKQKSVGVLCCPPIGQEYIRTHWTLRQLAGRLTREGFHALRFDYHGVGDSAGATGVGGIDPWVDDVHAAARELRDVSGGRKLSCVGLRLGAALAAQAVARGLKLQQLVLWDPVVSGAQHLAELDELQAAMLEDPMRYPAPRRDVGVAGEVLGFAYPPPLRQSLAALDLRTLELAGNVRQVLLVVSEERDEHRELHAALRGQPGLKVDHALVPDGGDWAVLSQQEETVLAAQIQARVVEQLGQSVIGGWGR